MSLRDLHVINKITMQIFTLQNNIFISKCCLSNWYEK